MQSRLVAMPQPAPQYALDILFIHVNVQLLHQHTNNVHARDLLLAREVQQRFRLDEVAGEFPEWLVCPGFQERADSVEQRREAISSEKVEIRLFAVTEPVVALQKGSAPRWTISSTRSYSRMRRKYASVFTIMSARLYPLETAANACCMGIGNWPSYRHRRLEFYQGLLQTACRIIVVISHS